MCLFFCYVYVSVRVLLRPEFFRPSLLHFVIKEQSVKNGWSLGRNCLLCFWVINVLFFFCYFYVVIVENVDFAHKIQRSSLFLVELYQKGTVLTSLKFHLAAFFDLTVILTS